jgi:hypothetical protein
VARSQMLYIGKQGALQYPAVGNIEMTDGCSGTLAMWYHPISPDQWCDVLKITTDTGDSLWLFRVQNAWGWRAVSSGSSQTISINSPAVAWRSVVVTWDFTGGPGQGVLRFYLDGEEVPESPLTGVSAPTGLPDLLTIGPGVENTRAMSHATYDHLAIRDGVMSAAQVAELHAAGHEHLHEEADGTGTLLLRASWDEQFDAEIAQGDGSATMLGEPDQYCRLDRRSRHRGKRFDYRIGTPAHDGSDDDRVPVLAVLPPGLRGQVNATNHEDHGELEIIASGVVQSVGSTLAPWLSAPQPPMTLRVGVHVAEAPAQIGAQVAVGAHEYFPGDALRFTAGSGCTQDTVTSPSLDQPDGYWAGAELHCLTGPLRGQKLRIADSSQSARSVTIDGRFAEAPGSSETFIVDRPRRIEPPHSNGYLHRLEGGLDEIRTDPRFVILELASIGSWGFSRFNLGRIQYYPHTITRDGVLFGKRSATELHAQWRCTILVDRVEMLGPGRYEITDRTDDTFMVEDPASGESIKAARVTNLEREIRRPQQHLDPEAVRAAMLAPGTWRHSLAYCPSWMEYDAKNERLVSVLVGIDPDGVERAGYIHGTWNEAAGLVEWEDDPDPRNPFLELDDLRAVVAGRSSPYSRLIRVNGVFEVDDGDWALVFTTSHGDPDGFTTCVLTGAPDPYSFDPAEHFDEELNPLTPPMNGYDKVVPEGGGIGLYANRDCEMVFVENPWARRGSDRFWGYGRAKTWHHTGTNLFYTPARPLSCAVTGDFRNIRHLPWRNQIVAPAYGWFHWPHPAWFGPSTVGLIVDDGSSSQSDVGLWASEDGVHLKRLISAVQINTPPFHDLWMMPQTNPVRLGGRRLYWYRRTMAGIDLNFASIRLDGEALYRLTDGEAEGELETCGLQREEERWEDLRLNVDPSGGVVTVAVLDAQSGSPVPGFRHADCEAIADDVEHRVRWNGVGLAEVPQERIRLQFRLARGGAGTDSPELYAWTIAPALHAVAPEVRAVQVEGATNPVAVANPSPRLSWSYADPDGSPQSAYQVLVASTRQKLEAGEGDLWDSGVVLSSEPVAKYAGAELDSERTYFWKVRVRNSEGAWSEQW